MTVYGKYTLEFEGTTYQVTLDPTALPTTTNPPNVVAKFVPIGRGDDNRIYSGTRDFWLDKNTGDGSALGTLYRVVS